ncbi:MAG: hypothetical protein JSU03_00975 [Bacteroidetes bacterium]|nr:hypothetical protein [Bacteroidota bacterium]MBS1755825.1 hypothetical protein [Bacteroidota bacterium]
MKTNKPVIYLIAFLLINAMLLTSCKKDSAPGTPAQAFPAPIVNIAPQSMIDSLVARGATIYSGTTPPIVNGIYLMTPDSCTYDNSPSNSAGSIYADYKFRFSGQDNAAFTLTVEQKAIATGVLNAAPVATYISGSGNNFSIFTLRNQSAAGIQGEIFNVFSGTLTSTGIKGLQNVLYVRSKGADPYNLLAVAGTVRVFINGGAGTAIKSDTF